MSRQELGGGQLLKRLVCPVTYLGESAGLGLWVMRVKPTGEIAQEMVKLLAAVPSQCASDCPHEGEEEESL